MSNLLEVEDLEVSFKTHLGKVKAVRGVSFSLAPLEIVGVVGESGCGKSVMAKSLLKLIPSTSGIIENGSALYDQKDLLTLSERKLRKIRGKEIGMIFQDPMSSLNPTLKIGKQVQEGLEHHYPSISSKEAKERCIELLTLVGIPDPETRYHQYPHELSGGMRQRVMIAIALAPSPKILIADEPTTALDVTIQAQILKLLKEIQEKTQTSILFITHDLSLVASFCTRVLVMYAGKIVESAPVDTLFNSPKHPYTKKLLQSIPRIDNSKKDLEPIDGKPPDLRLLIPGCSFCSRCPNPLDKCKSAAPSMMQVGSDQKAACWQFSNDEEA